MRYVALLRGINVGGKNRVEMARLRETISRAGADDVRTYIASGNVLFADSRPRGEIVGVLERAIEEEFGLSLKVLVRDEHDCSPPPMPSRPLDQRPDDEDRRHLPVGPHGLRGDHRSSPHPRWHRRGQVRARGR